GVEVVGDGLPGREVMRQHPPGAAASGQVEDGVDDLPQRVGSWPPGPPIALREQVLDVGPLEVGQVAGVSLPGQCGAHGDMVTGTLIPGEQRFLDGLLYSISA